MLHCFQIPPFLQCTLQHENCVLSTLESFYPLLFSLIKTLSHMNGSPKQREKDAFSKRKSIRVDKALEFVYHMALAVYLHYKTVRDIPTLSFQECHLLTVSSLLRLSLKGETLVSSPAVIFTVNVGQSLVRGLQRKVLNILALSHWYGLTSC